MSLILSNADIAAIFGLYERRDDAEARARAKERYLNGEKSSHRAQISIIRRNRSYHPDVYQTYDIWVGVAPFGNIDSQRLALFCDGYAMVYTDPSTLAEIRLTSDPTGMAFSDCFEKKPTVLALRIAHEYVSSL